VVQLHRTSATLDMVKLHADEGSEDSTVACAICPTSMQDLIGPNPKGIVWPYLKLKV